MMVLDDETTQEIPLESSNSTTGDDSIVSNFPFPNNPKTHDIPLSKKERELIAKGIVLPSVAELDIKKIDFDLARTKRILFRYKGVTYEFEMKKIY